MYCRYYIPYLHVYLSFFFISVMYLNRLFTVPSMAIQYHFHSDFSPKSIFHSLSPRHLPFYSVYVPSNILVKSMGRVDVVLSPHLEWSTLCFPEPKIINAIIACLSLLNAMAALGFAAGFFVYHYQKYLVVIKCEKPKPQNVAADSWKPQK